MRSGNSGTVAASRSEARTLRVTVLRSALLALVNAEEAINVLVNENAYVLVEMQCGYSNLVSR